MSFDSLTAMRKSGKKPRFVQVIVGTPPSWFEDSARWIVIDPAKVKSADWRPVIGMHVEFYEVGSHQSELHAAIDGAEAAGCLFGGLGSHAAVMGLDPGHESLIWRTWRHLNATLA